MSGRFPYFFIVCFFFQQAYGQVNITAISPAKLKSVSSISDSIIVPDSIPPINSKKVPGRIPIQKEEKEDTDFIIKKPSFRIHIGNMPEVVGKKVHSSRRAWMLSTAFPGLGQIYNRRYWKLPIIYGGFIGLALSINFNQRYYSQTLEYYKILLVNPASTAVPSQYSQVPAAQLATIKDFYRRNRDLSIIGAGALWMAGAVDAYVDSELKGFDVSNSLSFNLCPYVGPLGIGLQPSNIQFAYGLKATLNF